jgi:hypothetical protein
MCGTCNTKGGKEEFCDFGHKDSGSLGFWTLSIVLYSKKLPRKEATRKTYIDVSGWIILILGFCILLRVYHQSSSSTVRNSSLCYTLYYTIHTTCFGLTYRPSSGVIHKQIHKGATDLNGSVD